MSINSSHPLASSCVYAAATSTLSGGTLVDEVNGLNGSGFTADGTGFTSAGSVTLGTNTALDGLGARSLYVRAKVKTGVTSDDYLVGKGADVFSGGGWHLRTRASADKNLDYTIDGSGGDPSVTSPNDVYTLDGDYVDLVVRYNGSNALALDVDGVANSIVPVGTPKANTSDLLINFGGHFTFEYIYIFDREISYAEGESLRGSPQTLLEAPSSLIDITDSTMQRGTNFELVCSTPSTAPTTANTTLTNGNDTLTPSSVTGSDPYTLTFPVGDLSKQVDGTGYDWTLTVDAETATTGNIPLVIQAGYTKVDLVNPVTTNASLLFGYIGDAPVTGDDLEYDVTSVLDSGVTFSVAADGVWTVTEAVDGDWTTNITVDRRVVQVDGTIGATATMTFDATVLSNLTIDTSPSEIRTTEAFSFTVNSVTVPTTGNTTGNFSGLTGIAPSSVTGSGPYVITWTLPVGTSKLFSGTGYVFDITVDVDTVSSSEVPYLPVTGFSYVDLVSPVASEFTTSYSGTTPVTGDQAVYSTSTTPSGITVSVRSDLSWAIASSPASNQISKFYIVKADTTTGPTDNVIWSAP